MRILLYNSTSWVLVLFIMLVALEKRNLSTLSSFFKKQIFDPHFHRPSLVIIRFFPRRYRSSMERDLGHLPI